MKFFVAIRGRATALPFSFFLLALFCQAQIIVPNLFREKTVECGKIYRGEIIVVNNTNEKKEIRIEVQNILMTTSGVRLVDSEKEKYSMAEWVEFNWGRFYIEPMRRVKAPYIITVPKEIEAGTYHLLFLVKGMVPVKEIETEKMSLGIELQHGIQILFHIKGGKKDAEIFNVEMMEKDILNVDVRNTGVYWTTLKVGNDLLGEQEIKIYNGHERRIKFDCSSLEDKLYKDVRIILDDGDEFLKAQRINFRKGPLPKPLPPAKKVKGERLARRRGKPFSLYANLNYGNRRRGISLSGNLRFREFSLSAGSNYSQYYFGDAVSDFESNRLSINFRKEWFSAGMGNYWYDGRWVSTVRIGANFRKTQASLNYSVKYRILSANVTQRLRLFNKNFTLRIRGFKSENREDWNLSLMIPIL